MKLVEILAKELGEWPVKAENICQDANGCAYGWYGTPEWDCTYNDEWLCTESADVIDRVEVAAGLATDHATAIVTREMWQAERDRAVTGQGVSGDAGAKDWRLTESPSLHCQSVGRVYRGEDPRTSRDRIREIDATIEAMTAERAELVSKLAGEGFALIMQTAEPVEDVGDWPVDAPDRKSAPKWAQWIGRDRTGYYWFEGEPVRAKTLALEFARGLLGLDGYPDYRHEEALDMSNDLPLWSCKL